MKPEFKRKAVRSYVIRGGRMTESQKTAFDRYWPHLGLSLFAGALDPVREFGRSAPLVVEVGFGMGDSLFAMAEAEPDKDFIGIEVHPPGVGRLINMAGKADLKNLRVYMADAVDVLEDCIADESLDRFQLYFPDPWHKKKHHKRRIVQPEFLALLRRKLKPGALLHFATDWENYAEQMAEVLEAGEGLVSEAGTSPFVERPAFRPMTKFEQRGARLGHGVWDLLYSKVG
ncbi:tRNA (guanosine(46)-N7)-methyltransferase TrmB [Gilvimarinus sp. F26214L]|uniref:tRNA (guanosine(46)-N7)-methyltransferase TrmB n=1 Tax=Gilvimarinus sp. DZF01 TaxID=3461371 RepID=UPI00404544EF